MNAAYRARPAAIQNCIDETSEKVRELRARRDGGGEDPAINKALRKEQTKVGIPLGCVWECCWVRPPPPSPPPFQLRLMQSELVVESVIRDRSMKVRQL